MFMCCKTKKEIPVESGKGKKAAVNPKNDNSKTDKLSESLNPADIQPGWEIVFLILHFVSHIIMRHMYSLWNWNARKINIH